MPESITRLQALLDALAHRERGLRTAQALLAAAGGLLLAWVALAAAVNAGWLRPATGRGWVVAAAGLGVLAALPALRALRAAGDRRRQARRLESLDPALRGALVTVLDRAERPLGSPALLVRLADRVTPVAAAIPARVAVPAGSLRRAAGLLVAGAAAVVVAGAVLPTSPAEALAALWIRAEAPPAEAPRAEEGVRAVVGNITLRYLYPTYTRLEPLEVPNASGDVHAPPGTRVEVRARTAVPYEAATLEVYERPPEAVPLEGGRDVSAAFTVEGPGVWRFRFGELPSPDYQIVPDPDLAPDVSLDARQRRLSLAVDAPLPLVWTAKDDFGLRRVVIEIRQGGATREVELRAPLDAPRTLGDAARVTPRELGLAPGETATLRVKAWDNDEVSGSKAGSSAPVEVEVLGPRGVAARLDAARHALRDALVRTLAGFVVEEAPVVRTAEAGPRWAVEANDRFEAFDRLVAETWAGAEATGADATAIREVNDKRRAVLGFARTLGSASGRVTEKDLDTLATLQAEHVETLEAAVLLFDRMVRAAAAAAVAELTTQVAAEARELLEDLDRLTPAEALARLDQLQRLLQQLAAEAERLGDAQLLEFLNERGETFDALTAEIKAALAEGRAEDAEALLERLAQQLQDMADTLQAQSRQQSGEADRLQQAMQSLQQDLERLERDQQALRERTEAAREQHGQDLDQAVRVWEEVERRARAVTEALRAAEGGSVTAGMPSGFRLDVADLRAGAEGLEDSARARDLEAALQRAAGLEDDLAWSAAQLNRGALRATDAQGARAVAGRIAAQAPEVRRIRELLEQMAEERTTGSPELQQELQRMAAEQQSIEERAQDAAERAGELAEQLPMQAPGLERGARQGAEQSGRAAEAMQDGDAMGAEGGQRAAEEGFRQARSSLEQAQRDLRSMQPGQRGDQGEGEAGGEPGADGDEGGTDEPMALPAPEEFQTPEAYRRALLEGMSGEVPDEYRPLNQRYYEELVRQ